MNKTLLVLSFGALTLSALAVQVAPQGVSLRRSDERRLAIGHQPDPRLSQLPVTVGTAPGGGPIGRYAASDKDFAEGLASFREKRAARFQGR